MQPNQPIPQQPQPNPSPEPTPTPQPQPPLQPQPQPQFQPQPTPVQNPAPAPQASTPAPQPPHQPVSNKKAIKPVLALVVLVAIIGFVVYAIFSQGAEKNDLVENGVKVEGIATGEAEYTQQRARRSTSTFYVAEYEYTRQDGTKDTAFGERRFESADEVVAGTKADVYYDPNDTNKRPYVDDEIEE